MSFDDDAKLNWIEWSVVGALVLAGAYALGPLASQMRDRMPAAVYRQRVDQTGARLAVGARPGELPGTDLVDLYASYDANKLAVLADEQQRKFGAQESLSLREIWALGNVLRVICYNDSIGDGASLSPLRFDDFVDGMSGNKNAVGAEVILNSRRAKNILAAEKTIAGKDSFAIAELANLKTDSAGGLYASAKARADADEQFRRNAAALQLMNQTIRNMNSTVNSFQSGSSGK